jgi:hypothetical protein
MEEICIRDRAACKVDAYENLAIPAVRYDSWNR